MKIGNMTNSYPAEYECRIAGKNAEQIINGFEEQEAPDQTDFWEREFANIGQNAPERVKNAWMEASMEAGVDGMGMMPDGKLGHLSAMMVNRVEARYNGEVSTGGDVLGSTVESALQAAKQALYDLENPLQPISERRLEVQQQMMKEKHFYQLFIDKLEQ